MINNIISHIREEIREDKRKREETRENKRSREEIKGDKRDNDHQRFD